LINNLAEKCGEKERTGIKWIYTSSLTVKEILKEALKCANEVHEFIQKEWPKPESVPAPAVPARRVLGMALINLKMGGGKKNQPEKKVWIDLDKKFEAELQKIWILEQMTGKNIAGGSNVAHLKENTRLYQNCNQLSESTLFDTMIDELSGESKITIVKEDFWNEADGKVNYTKFIQALQKYMDNVDSLIHISRTGDDEGPVQQVSQSYY
jgi:hypothetical protein